MLATRNDLLAERALALVDHEAARLEAVVQRRRTSRPRGSQSEVMVFERSSAGSTQRRPEARRTRRAAARPRGVARDARVDALLEQLGERLVERVGDLHRGRERLEPRSCASSTSASER